MTVLAPFMAMPEAAMYHNDATPAGEYEVGLTWECLIVQTITVTERMR
jgi:hypothetical protein